MGKVFTWDELRLGRIPALENFKKVQAMIRATILDTPAIVSALLFGSVVRGDYTIRSDVDCVVLYRHGSQEAALAATNEIAFAAQELHVPLNFVPCDTILARTRLHHLGTAFRQHLRSSIDAGGLIKGDLMKSLVATVSQRHEIESYLKMKAYSIQESMMQTSAMSDERMAAFLKKALEAPVHVARKMLMYNDVLDGDSVQDVQERFREVMSPSLADRLDKLIELDRWYSAALESQMHCPSREHYDLTIEHLEEATPEVLDFLRFNILLLSKARQ
ncbi:MAG TPA: nucleotidyltransferase domain-containing protein [Candidatus Paceibacterota bacterium]|nr:nucleotidyltransferase domain-containing protein [Candidatus Paceibacterota bacterium]